MILLYLVRGRILKTLFSVFNFLNMYYLSAVILSCLIRELDKDGRRVKLSGDLSDKRINILILNRLHYIDFVRQISRAQEFRCLDLPWEVLGQMRLAFVPDPTEAEVVEANIPVPGNRHVYQCSLPGSRIAKDRKKYQNFLSKVLPLVFERFRVDCVLNSDARFCREVDIVQVAEKIGTSHVCVTRESMFLTPGLRDRVVKRHRYFEPFKGTKLFAQNLATKEALVKAGYVREEQVSVIGSIRSKALLDAIKRGDNNCDSQTHNSVVMFTWPPKCYGPNGYRVELEVATQRTVRALCEAALIRQDVQFYIKPKHNHASAELLKPIRDIILSYGECVADRVSLLSKDVDPLPLLLEARVVVAMQSTTVLEAAMAGKAVILPHFSDIRADVGYSDALLYSDKTELFDVPDTEEELTSLVLKRLENPFVSDGKQKSREAMFEEHVCPIDGDVLKRFVSEITSCVRD